MDAEAAERVFEALQSELEADAWKVVDAARPALAPVFAASPYLAGLARRRPRRLADLLSHAPDLTLRRILEGARVAGSDEAAASVLRRAKADLHLLTALADLGGVWDLDAVTSALTLFADAATNAALTVAAAAERRRGRLLEAAEQDGPVPGLFVLALGKHGAGELNYSSDIDISAFFEPDRLPVAAGVEPQAVAVRIIKATAALLQERTSDGYVFRVDLRLRPDPAMTRPAVPVDAALDYYRTVGQNWERAAFIKARWCAGDKAEGERFLAAMSPFVWRRSLDFSALEDVKAVKQQIHAVRGGEELVPAGADLKLGRGGIREVEFFVQTQQLILGGRHPELRARRTLEGLAALVEAGQVERTAADELSDAYRRLRALEHRVQMVRDEHSHRLPADDEERARVAALAGASDVAAFDREVAALLTRVNRRYGELFSDAEPLSVPEGSLVFTGVEDDPATLETLSRMGFTEAARVSSTVRDWHHGRTPATASERGRELLTRLAPRLLRACADTGIADTAFVRFAAFFGGLRAGVQVQALLLANAGLLALLVQVLAFAPRLAQTLARGPAALDALLDPEFFDPPAPPSPPAVDVEDLEGAMNAVRRFHRERSFRIGVHVLSGRLKGEAAGRAQTDLADACIQALAPAAFADVVRTAGPLAGEAAVLALGRAGSGELAFGSDLDLMLVYDAPAGAASAAKGWMAETWFGRACQRLAAALSTHTNEGGLYPVDLRLRPTGGKGPVAVPLSGFADYYLREAETWERMALTRARVAWASSPAFASVAADAVESGLRRAPPPSQAQDVREMRALMTREKAARHGWDLKLGDGGFVDVEFAAQHLQLLHAAAGGPLRRHPVEALLALLDAGLADAAVVSPLVEAHRLITDLSQVLRVAFEHDRDPSEEPESFRMLLAEVAGEPTYAALQQRLDAVRADAHAAFLTATTP